MKETETNRTNKNNKQRDRKKSYINTYIFVNQKKMSPAHNKYLYNLKGGQFK